MRRAVQHRAEGRAHAPVPLGFLAILATAALGVALGSRPAAAQFLERPWLNWRTVHAGRFAIHFPAPLESWARFVASRMPAIDSSVSRRVGYSPGGRVDIVVEDPYAVANGSAFPFVERPVMVFWATPPDPRESIGQFRSWAEMLGVHEFAHVAHLTRPSRNLLQRALWRVAPVDLGPITLRAPRWVIEGYATYVEGDLTGSGRPFGFWRAAVLRRWAVEGRLPTYAQLSGWRDFEGGSFAYLAGSAFLEWLTRRPGAGDSSLVFVWRRLTARVNRSFDDAFAGIYGDSPATLYGRFVAELTADAMAAERDLDRGGIVDGELVQHLSWATGDPSVSPDGQRVALVLRSNTRPARVVVWGTAAEPDTTAERVRKRLLERDPADVPARRAYPPPKRIIVSLRARNGRSFEDPRWFADGRRVLLWRSTRRPDGSFRPDLYEWNVESRRVRQLTHGAGVRDADPAPDGRSAVGLRCEAGQCDVVSVDLAIGSTRVIAAGDSLTSFSRPRMAADGRRIAVAVRRADRWRIALVDATTGALRVVDPDDGADRFDPAWLGADALAVVSDRSGTANLERLKLVPGGAALVTALTRVTGAAVAPCPNPADSSIWFLSLHSRGYDVRRLPSVSRVVDSGASGLFETRYPLAGTRQGEGRGFSPGTVPPSKPYGIGARITRWFPAGVLGAGGRAIGFGIVNSDVVGTLTLLAQAQLGNGDAWRGVAVDAAWRRPRPELRVSAFAARQQLLPLAGTSPGGESDIELRGGHVRAGYSRAFDAADLSLSGGISGARLEALAIPGSIAVPSRLARSLAFAEAGLAARQTRDAWSASETIALHGTVGRTGPNGDFRRGLVSLSVRSGGPRILPVNLSATYGRVSPEAPPFERFVLGGLPSALFDPSLITQRVPMPALPAGVAGGDRVLVLRAATSLGLLAPFYWAGSARDGPGRFERWHRVVGAELVFDERALGVVGTPGARLTAGVARSLDAPVARRLRGYVTLTLRP